MDAVLTILLVLFAILLVLSLFAPAFFLPIFLSGLIILLTLFLQIFWFGVKTIFKIFWSGVKTIFNDKNFKENFVGVPDFSDKGYAEEAARREEAQQITIKIGVAVAMSDGSFDDSEGEVIKKWIAKTIAGYSEKKRESLKNIYNDAFKSAYHDASNRKLSFSDLSRLNDIGEKKTKFDALELAYEVMAADGVADPEELKMIRMIGEQLNLDMDEVEKIRSRIMITLPDDVFTDKETLEQLFGIDKNWDKGKIKAHLATEFQRWNGRMNALAEGKEKDKAQNMLNKIGEARKKYDIE